MSAPASPVTLLPVRVVPQASRDEIVGWLGADLKVKLRAPALEGRANAALVAFIADRLGVPPRTVALARGEKSRQKLLRIAGLDPATVRERLAR